MRQNMLLYLTTHHQKEIKFKLLFKFGYTALDRAWGVQEFEEFPSSAERADCTLAVPVRE